MNNPRAEILERVLGEVTNPSLAGCLVRGGAGLGKTMMGQEVEAALAGRILVTWLSGQRLLSGQPFAIFESILPGIPAVVAADQTTAGMSIVQMLYTALLDRGAELGQESLLVVDNAQWLDRDSCAVVEQLAVSGAVRILLLCRPGDNEVAQSPLFTDDTLFAQHWIPFLTPSEVVGICERRLGGKIVPGAALVLGHACGGHPLFLRVMLDAAVELGTIVRHGNVWVLTSAATDISSHVADLSLDLLKEYTEAEQGILEAIALAEPLSVALLHRLFPGEGYGALIQSEFIRLAPGASSTVEFTAPIFGQVLRQCIPVGRSVSIRRQLVEARAQVSLSSEALMRHIAWSYDCGVPVSDRSLLHAARLANSHEEPQLALRLCVAVNDSGYVFRARLEGVLARIKLHQISVAKALLEDLVTMVTTGEECDALGALGVMILALDGYPADRLEILAQRWRQHYRILGLDDCAGADLVQALVIVRSGYPLTEGQHERLLSMAAAEGQIGLQCAATALLAHAAVLRGDHCGAERDFTRARSLLVRHLGWLGLFNNVLLGQHMLFLAELGYPDRALEIVHERRAAAVGHPAASEIQGLYEFVRALAAMSQGRLRQAVAGFDVAIGALAESDPVYVLPYALSQAAYASYLVGDSTRARDLARQYHQLIDDDAVPILLVAKACLVVVEGTSRRGSFVALNDLAEQARGYGAAAVELAIHKVLMQAGCSDYLERILDIEIVSTGPVVPMIKTMARALISEDAEMLEGIADFPGAESNTLLAAEALGHALELHRRRGNHDGRAKVLAQLRGMEFPFQATGSPAIAVLASAAELSARESEIAVLVHRRFSNRDIAEKFTLSQRTIEGHLYKIYSKLGISSREELYEPWLPQLLATTGK